MSRCKCYLILNGHGYQPCRKNVFLILALAAEALVEVSLESAAPPGFVFSCRAWHGTADSRAPSEPQLWTRTFDIAFQRMTDELFPEIVNKIRLRTPARLLHGRSGGGYRTATQLELRGAHAAARDAVRSDLDLSQHLGGPLIERFRIFEVCSQVRSKDEYLLRPDLGRRLSLESGEKILAKCAAKADVQILIGDGLSTTAIATQVPALLPLLVQGATDRGWVVGQPFVVRFCRVGILNEVGELLHPSVAVLLIGERPGLATAESLSAYMAFKPNVEHTDANRNLISNIHGRGVGIREAATRILNLCVKMMRARSSGVRLREELPERIPGQLPG